MGFKELLERIRGNGEDKESIKEYVKELNMRTRAEKIVTERSKSANQRELERLYKEEQDKQIKDELEYMRKKRQKDINFSHNPLATKFVMGKGDFEILKDKKLFANHRNMFSNQKNIFTPKR
jgi:hypothetical protein